MQTIDAMHTYEEMEPRGGQRQKLTVDRPLRNRQPPPHGLAPLLLSLLRTAHEPSPLLNGLVKLALDPLPLLQSSVRRAPGLARICTTSRCKRSAPCRCCKAACGWLPASRDGCATPCTGSARPRRFFDN